MAFSNAATLQLDENLRRLEVATNRGDTDNDGDFDELYAFGGRSFSIFDAAGTLVFDSGDGFEQIIAALLPGDFDTDNDENDFDSHSDAKGPQPEALTIVEIDGMMLAFIGLERIGGIMVYYTTDPNNPFFVNCVTTRIFGGKPADGTAGDLGPEGLLFIPASKSLNGKNLLTVANEVSGTANLFEIKMVPAPATLFLIGLGLVAMRGLRKR